eukprot:gene1628-997_t
MCMAEHRHSPSDLMTTTSSSSCLLTAEASSRSPAAPQSKLGLEIVRNGPVLPLSVERLPPPGGEGGSGVQVIPSLPRNLCSDSSSPTGQHGRRETGMHPNEPNPSDVRDQPSASKSAEVFTELHGTQSTYAVGASTSALKTDSSHGFHLHNHAGEQIPSNQLTGESFVSAHTPLPASGNSRASPHPSSSSVSVPRRASGVWRNRLGSSSHPNGHVQSNGHDADRSNVVQVSSVATPPPPDGSWEGREAEGASPLSAAGCGTHSTAVHGSSPPHQEAPSREGDGTTSQIGLNTVLRHRHSVFDVLPAPPQPPAPLASSNSSVRRQQQASVAESSTASTIGSLTGSFNRRSTMEGQMESPLALSATAFPPGSGTGHPRSSGGEGRRPSYAQGTSQPFPFGPAKAMAMASAKRISVNPPPLMDVTSPSSCSISLSPLQLQHPPQGPQHPRTRGFHQQQHTHSSSDSTLSAPIDSSVTSFPPASGAGGNANSSGAFLINIGTAPPSLAASVASGSMMGNTMTSSPFSMGFATAAFSPPATATVTHHPLLQSRRGNLSQTQVHRPFSSLSPSPSAGAELGMSEELPYSSGGSSMGGKLPVRNSSNGSPLFSGADSPCQLVEGGSCASLHSNGTRGGGGRPHRKGPVCGTHTGSGSPLPMHLCGGEKAPSPLALSNDVFPRITSPPVTPLDKLDGVDAALFPRGNSLSKGSLASTGTQAMATAGSFKRSSASGAALVSPPDEPSTPKLATSSGNDPGTSPMLRLRSVIPHTNHSPLHPAGKKGYFPSPGSSRGTPSPLCDSLPAGRTVRSSSHQVFPTHNGQSNNSGTAAGAAGGGALRTGSMFCAGSPTSLYMPDISPTSLQHLSRTAQQHSSGMSSFRTATPMLVAANSRDTPTLGSVTPSRDDDSEPRSSRSGALGRGSNRPPTSEELHMSNERPRKSCFYASAGCGAGEAGVDPHASSSEKPTSTPSTPSETSQSRGSKPQKVQRHGSSAATGSSPGCSSAPRKYPAGKICSPKPLSSVLEKPPSRTPSIITFSASLQKAFQTVTGQGTSTPRNGPGETPPRRRSFSAAEPYAGGPDSPPTTLLQQRSGDDSTWSAARRREVRVVGGGDLPVKSHSRAGSSRSLKGTKEGKGSKESSKPSSPTSAGSRRVMPTFSEEGKKSKKTPTVGQLAPEGDVVEGGTHPPKDASSRYQQHSPSLLPQDEAPSAHAKGHLASTGVHGADATSPSPPDQPVTSQSSPRRMVLHHSRDAGNTPEVESAHSSQPPTGSVTPIETRTGAVASPLIPPLEGSGPELHSRTPPTPMQELASHHDKEEGSGQHPLAFASRTPPGTPSPKHLRPLVPLQDATAVGGEHHVLSAYSPHKPTATSPHHPSPHHPSPSLPSPTPDPLHLVEADLSGSNSSSPLHPPALVPPTARGRGSGSGTDAASAVAPAQRNPSSTVPAPCSVMRSAHLLHQPMPQPSGGDVATQPLTASASEASAMPVPLVSHMSQIFCSVQNSPITSPTNSGPVGGGAFDPLLGTHRDRVYPATARIVPHSSTSTSGAVSLSAARPHVSSSIVRTDDTSIRPPGSIASQKALIAPQRTPSSIALSASSPLPSSVVQPYSSSCSSTASPGASVLGMPQGSTSSTSTFGMASPSTSAALLYPRDTNFSVPSTSPSVVDPYAAQPFGTASPPPPPPAAVTVLADGVRIPTEAPRPDEERGGGGKAGDGCGSPSCNADGDHFCIVTSPTGALSSERRYKHRRRSKRGSTAPKRDRRRKHSTTTIGRGGEGDERSSGRRSGSPHTINEEALLSAQEREDRPTPFVLGDEVQQSTSGSSGGGPRDQWSPAVIARSPSQPPPKLKSKVLSVVQTNSNSNSLNATPHKQSIPTTSPMKTSTTSSTAAAAQQSRPASATAREGKEGKEISPALDAPPPLPPPILQFTQPLDGSTTTANGSSAGLFTLLPVSVAGPSGTPNSNSAITTNTVHQDQLMVHSSDMIRVEEYKQPSPPAAPQHSATAPSSQQQLNDDDDASGSHLLPHILQYNSSNSSMICDTSHEPGPLHPTADDSPSRSPLSCQTSPQPQPLSAGGLLASSSRVPPQRSMMVHASSFITDPDDDVGCPPRLEFFCPRDSGIEMNFSPVTCNVEGFASMEASDTGTVNTTNWRLLSVHSRPSWISSIEDLGSVHRGSQTGLPEDERRPPPQSDSDGEEVFLDPQQQQADSDPYTAPKLRSRGPTVDHSPSAQRLTTSAAHGLHIANPHHPQVSFNGRNRMGGGFSSRRRSSSAAVRHPPPLGRVAMSAFHPNASGALEPEPEQESLLFAPPTPGKRTAAGSPMLGTSRTQRSQGLLPSGASAGNSLASSFRPQRGSVSSVLSLTFNPAVAGAPGAPNHIYSTAGAASGVEDSRSRTSPPNSSVIVVQPLATQPYASPTTHPAGTEPSVVDDVVISPLHISTVNPYIFPLHIYIFIVPLYIYI